MKSLAFTPWRSSVNYDLGVRHSHTHSVASFERFGVDSSLLMEWIPLDVASYRHGG